MPSPPPSYTTIPPSTAPPPPPPPSAADFTSRTTQIHQSLVATLRPWRELLDLSALSIPVSSTEATYRIRQNLYYFRLNYTIIVLLILFFSLLYHPLSIIVFLITFVAWLYLYLFRDEPLVVFSRLVDDRVVLVLLSVFTLVALILSRVWLNVVVSVLIGVALVCLHGAIRAPEDFGDQESPYGSLLSVVDSPRGAYNRV